ncbi:MAG: hypothetical protein ACYDDZ_11800 [Acidimicrobiales bacterium]
MSPRAAYRLEALCFTAVCDYTAGKDALLAAGLPTEGTAVTTLWGGALAPTGVPTGPTKGSAAKRSPRHAGG